MKTFPQIAEEVLLEIVRSQMQWGSTFDDKNTLNDWATYVNIYVGKATAMGASDEEVKKGLRKAAGLILSALYRAENGGFAPRHYEGQARPASLPEIPVK